MYRKIFRLIIIIMIAVLAVNMLPHLPADAVAQGDAMSMFGLETDNSPKTRTWLQDKAYFGSLVSLPAIAGAIRHVVIKAAPNRSEYLAGIQAADNKLYVYRWDGTSWLLDWTGPVIASHLPSFDIGYEQVSGQAVIFFTSAAFTSGGATPELKYRVWDGTSWGGVMQYNALHATGVICAVTVATRPGSDDIGVAWADLTRRMSTAYWDGSTNNLAGEPATLMANTINVVAPSGVPTNFSFRIAFESMSGRLLLVWGRANHELLYYAVRGSGPGGVWGPLMQNAATFEKPMDVVLESDPESNRIIYANISDISSDAEAALWDGSAWTAQNGFDSTTSMVENGTKNLAVCWLRKNGQTRVVLTFDDFGTTGIDWLYFDVSASAWSSVQPPVVLTPELTAANDKLHIMRANPFFPEQGLLTIVDGAGFQYSKRVLFDGDTFTWDDVAQSKLTPTSRLSYGNSFNSDFAFAHKVTPQLGVTITDPTGKSINMPVVPFAPVTSMNACQMTAGFIGDELQRIRITNTTTDPTWSLSIAATNGAQALWQGITAYDYNDSSGIEPGCQDGPDTDGLAGQLRIDPVGTSITPQAGCSTNGISRGVAADFQQGLIESIELASGTGTADSNCHWDLEGIGIAQAVPAYVLPGEYRLDLTITLVAD